MWQFAEDGNSVDLPTVPRKARTGGFLIDVEVEGEQAEGIDLVWKLVMYNK